MSRRAGFPRRLSLRRIAEVLADLVLLAGAYVLAFLPFVSGPGNQSQQDAFWESFPILLAVTAIVFVLLGAYSHDWQQASVRDLVNFALATVGATAIAVVVILASIDLGDLSVGVFGLHALIAAGAVTGVRIALRLREAHAWWRGRSGGSGRGV